LQGLGPLPALSPSATALFCSILYTYTLCHALKLLTVFKNGIVFFKNLNLFFKKFIYLFIYIFISYYCINIKKKIYIILIYFQTNI
jgi:hypothetical protein